VLSKNENFNTEFKGIDLENIDANVKKKFKLEYGVKIKSISYENLAQYTNELVGNIILSNIRRRFLCYLFGIWNGRTK
jgi:hypothetical protein